MAADAETLTAPPLAAPARAQPTASRIEALKRSNLALDARIAARAMELGEARNELDAWRADRTRLVASIQALNSEVERLSSVQHR